MIGIIADSHDNIPAIRQAVRIFNEAECSLVVHAGDFVAPFAAKEFSALPCPFKAVYGNCDGEKDGLAKVIGEFGEVGPAPVIFKHNDLSFLITHLHSPIKTYLIKGKPDVLVFGHTHKPEIRKQGRTILINPGELGGWLSGKSTVALFDPKSLEAEIVFL